MKFRGAAAPLSARREGPALQRLLFIERDHRDAGMDVA
jgi:hypothetical protein